MKPPRRPFVIWPLPTSTPRPQGEPAGSGAVPGAVTTARRARAGFLVIRAWAEPEGGMRARITLSSDAAGDEPRLLMAGDPEAVYEHVREWLQGCLGDDHAREDRPSAEKH